MYFSSEKPCLTDTWPLYIANILCKEPFFKAIQRIQNFSHTTVAIAASCNT